MAFDTAAVNSLFNEVMSTCLVLGVFDQVNSSEPKSAPQNGITAAVWIDTIVPAGAASGLSATSGVVTLNIRCYTSMIQPAFALDAIDPNLTIAATTLLNAFTGKYTLDNTVRDIDLLGMYGKSMSATAGYIQIDNKHFRVMTVVLPVVINDLWTMAA